MKRFVSFIRNQLFLINFLIIAINIIYAKYLVIVLNTKRDIPKKKVLTAQTDLIGYRVHVKPIHI